MNHVWIKPNRRSDQTRFFGLPLSLFTLGYAIWTFRQIYSSTSAAQVVFRSLVGFLIGFMLLLPVALVAVVIWMVRTSGSL